MPIKDPKLCIQTARLGQELGRCPRVSELPFDMQVALGRKIFEFLDYRDKHFPQMSDEYVYCGCLADHGVDRDTFDGIDSAQARHLMGVPDDMPYGSRYASRGLIQAIMERLCDKKEQP